VITRAAVIDLPKPESLMEISMEATRLFTQRYPMLDENQMVEDFIKSMGSNYTFVEQGVTMPNLRLNAVNHTEVVIVRSRDGILLDHDSDSATEKVTVHAFFFVISPNENPGQHLRILAQLINHIETDDFAHTWAIAQNEQELKEILLHTERLLTLWINENTRTASLIGKAIQDLKFPTDTLIALIRRDEDVVIPRGNALLDHGDRITIIGEPDSIQWLFEEYVSEHQQELAVTPGSNRSEI